MGTDASYLHRDQLASVQLISNAAGERATRRQYRPFGEISWEVTEQVTADEAHGFIGERFDEGAGLQYLNARYYDPELGLFLQPDWFEVTKAGVGTNRYAYSFNDPVNARDPGGNEFNGIETVEREDWAQYPPDLESLDSDPEDDPYNTVTLHHSGNHLTPQSVEDLHRGKNNGILRSVAAALGLAQTYDFADVGCDFMIDQDGVIYEGRGLEFMGAHVRGNNENNIGIAVLGDYSESELNEKQIDAIDRLLGAINDKYAGETDASGDAGSGGLTVRSHGYYDSVKHDELLGARSQLAIFGVVFER